MMLSAANRAIPRLRLYASVRIDINFPDSIFDTLEFG